MVYFILTILFIVILISAFIIRNLMIKSEKQEEILLSYLEYINKVSTAIEEADIRLKEIDDKGIFESDDEIGWFFSHIKELKEIFNDFVIKQVE